MYRRFEALVLEGIVSTVSCWCHESGKLAALCKCKALALLKIQFQKRPAGFAFKSAFPYFHPASSCKAAVNNASGDRSNAVPPSPDLQGPAMRPLSLVQLRASRKIK